MDLNALATEFLASEHGANAGAALASQGVSASDAQTLLSHATVAAGEHTEQHAAGLLGSHPGRSFFAAFATGLIKGDGIMGAFKDGAEGVIVARVAEALASRAGVDSGTASTVAATATPYIVAFLKQKLG